MTKPSEKVQISRTMIKPTIMGHISLTKVLIFKFEIRQPTNRQVPTGGVKRPMHRLTLSLYQGDQDRGQHRDGRRAVQQHPHHEKQQGDEEEQHVLVLSDAHKEGLN